MTSGGSSEGQVLGLAEKVAGVLARSGVESALIGAVALAVHRYPRSTEDIDLAVGIEPRQLEKLAQELGREGFSTEVSLPDNVDPLGGVLRVRTADTERVEVVNFCNPPAGGFPALIAAALRDARPLREGISLRVVTLPHLILFKLYAGGVKSKNDVLELLSRNPEINVNELREVCRQFRLERRLEAWLREWRQPEE